MIDKVVAFKTVMTLLLHYSLSAPTSLDIHNLNETTIEGTSAIEKNTYNSSVSTNSLIMPLMKEKNFNKDSTTTDTNTTFEKTLAENGQLQLNSSTFKSNLKARKNNNDLYFCCTEDTFESLSFPNRKNKDREKNTKSPIRKQKKSLEEEDPYMERRPALLLRFFPDGTAVLISKFQLHLHVKPKQIKFEPDEGSEGETIELNPIILSDEKNYEVTYKRLEAIPSSREQNEFDLDESEEREAYSKDLHQPDHEFLTTSATVIGGKNNKTSRFEKLSPIFENTSQSDTTELKNNMTIAASKNESKPNTTEKLLPVMNDSPFFMMTDEEMSSLQKQYDPTIASLLQATTSSSIVNESSMDVTTTSSSTTSVQQTTFITSVNSAINSSPNSTSTKCLSFKTQLSLALSTEDNIDNSLLKRQIFPTLDCANSSSASNPFANLKKSDDTTTVPPSALPIITRLNPEPTTTPSYIRNNFAPNANSPFYNYPTNPDIFVVTSLPMLIDIKTSRNQPITNAPAWREVTVGVVRDQKGQPLKPRYNNWTAHLRGIRKKAENNFWNDFTTPKPNIRSHSREPLQQNIQHSSSQINRAFWNDLLGQNNMSGKRNEDKMNTHRYLSNPPRNYPLQNKSKFQFWRIRTPNVDSGWNTDINSNAATYSMTREPPRSSYADFRNMENRQNTQWNQGNQHQNDRRW